MYTVLAAAPPQGRSSCSDHVLSHFWGPSGATRMRLQAIPWPHTQRPRSCTSTEQKPPQMSAKCGQPAHFCSHIDTLNPRGYGPCTFTCCSSHTLAVLSCTPAVSAVAFVALNVARARFRGSAKHPAYADGPDWPRNDVVGSGFLGGLYQATPGGWDRLALSTTAVINRARASQECSLRVSSRADLTIRRRSASCVR